MRFSIILSALAVTFPVTFAAPADSHAGDALEKRLPVTITKWINREVAEGEKASTTAAITHLYVCDSINFTGRCENLESVTGQCYNLYNRWPDTISSLGPDQGTTCYVYEDINCSGRSISVVYPGITNLVDYNFNDVISSYRCS